MDTAATSWSKVARRGLPALALLLATASGCQTSNPMFEPHGKVFYLDGAGGWGYGVQEVPEGLRRGGYTGDCEVFDWSATRIPLLDQVDPLGVNKLSATALAKRIAEYKKRFPRQEVNIVALSAGTGVAVWALEKLKGRFKVNNLFLLGSSLSSSYDIRPALASVKGHVYVYHSENDAMLQFVKTIGTVDKRLYVPVAGLVGLQGKGSDSHKVVNIGWNRKWDRLGWRGGHTDCVGRSFVQYEIARKLMQGARSDEALIAAPEAGASPASE